MARQQPSAEPFKQICEQLLLAIPGPDEKPLRLADLRVDFAGLTRDQMDAAGQALIALLAHLGLLESADESLIRAPSDLACALLHSLGHYVAADLPLLGDWRARGESEDARRHRQLLGLVEEYRVLRQGAAAPASRQVEAVAAIIKGQLGGEEVYLVQYNPFWRIPWWIGGIVEGRDRNPEAALRREIEEELGLPPTAVEGLRPFAEVTYRRLSARQRTLTDYHTRFYAASLNAAAMPAELLRSPNELTLINRDGRGVVRQNYWLSWSQLRKYPGFEAVAANVASALEQHGVAKLSAPHTIRPAATDLHPDGPGHWDTRWSLAQQAWLATRVQEYLPVIEEICDDARRDLKTLTDDDSFDAYLSKNPERVQHQAHAIYATLRRRGIPYRLEPWDSSNGRQRVRLPREVLKGTAVGGCCIELACVMASCLLALHIDPLLVVLEEHALLGYWLVDFPQRPPAQTVIPWADAAAEMGRMQFVEATCLTLPQACPFDEARRMAEGHLADGTARFLVDVRACREANFLPAGQGQ